MKYGWNVRRKIALATASRGRGAMFHNCLGPFDEPLVTVPGRTNSDALARRSFTLIRVRGVARSPSWRGRFGLPPKRLSDARCPCVSFSVGFQRSQQGRSEGEAPAGCRTVCGGLSEGDGKLGKPCEVTTDARLLPYPPRQRSRLGSMSQDKYN